MRLGEGNLQLGRAGRSRKSTLSIVCRNLFEFSQHLRQKVIVELPGLSLYDGHGQPGDRRRLEKIG